MGQSDVLQQPQIRGGSDGRQGARDHIRHGRRAQLGDLLGVKCGIRSGHQVGSISLAEDRPGQLLRRGVKISRSVQDQVGVLGDFIGLSAAGHIG